MESTCELAKTVVGCGMENACDLNRSVAGCELLRSVPFPFMLGVDIAVSSFLVSGALSVESVKEGRFFSDAIFVARFGYTDRSGPMNPEPNVCRGD
jgi:hypothetical protein